MTRIPGLTVASILAVACVSQAQAFPIEFIAFLDGPSENPANASPATGTAFVTIDSVAHTMRVEVIFADLTSGNTAAHIHCCVAPPGNVMVATTTPTFAGFPTGATSGTYDFTFDMTLASSYNAAFVTAHGGTTASAEADLFAGIEAGQAYLNIHTSNFPGGEIRGFLQAVPEPASLALFGLGIAGLGVIRRRRTA